MLVFEDFDISQTLEQERSRFYSQDMNMKLLVVVVVVVVVVTSLRTAMTRNRKRLVRMVCFRLEDSGF